MKKYIGITILLSLEVLLFALKPEWGAINLFGLWTAVFAVITYRKFLNLYGSNLGTFSTGYDVAKGKIKDIEQEYSNKETSYSLKPVNTKWFYLAATVINAGLCVLLIVLR